MSTNFHVNPITGRSGRCDGKIKGCKFKNTHPDTPHFGTKEEAETYANSLNEKKHGLIATVKKAPRKPVVHFDEPEIIRVEGGGYGGNAWVGNKRGEGYLSDAEYAKKIRADIKTASAAGWIDGDVKYSVTSTGGSIRVKIEGDWEEDELYDYTPSSWGRLNRKLKPEFQTLKDRVEAIQNSYNYYDSNPQIDYFNTGFYSHADLVTPYEKSWKNFEKESKKLKAIENAGIKAGMSRQEARDSPEYKEQLEPYEDSLSILFLERRKTVLLNKMVDRGEVPVRSQYIDRAVKEAVDEFKGYLSRKHLSDKNR